MWAYARVIALTLRGSARRNTSELVSANYQQSSKGAQKSQNLALVSNFGAIAEKLDTKWLILYLGEVVSSE